MENLILQNDTNPEKFLDQTTTYSKMKRNKTLIHNFRELVLLPNIIGDKEYLSRKKTFDTFLKKTDTEFFNMYLKSFEKVSKTKGPNFKVGYDANQKESERNKDKKLDKKPQGKMLSNELWSENYYRSIINSSYIRSKFEKIVNEIKSRKYETKIKITDDYYKRKHQSFYHRQSMLKGLFNEYDSIKTPLLVINEKYEQKIERRSLSDWVNRKKKGNDVENMREDMYGLIKTCYAANEMNNSLKK